MKKIAFALSAITVALAGTAYASDRLSANDAAGTLPPAYIVHKLTSDGIALRSLEAEDGIYEARVQATDGSIVKVGIDPQTAELTDAYSHARARNADGAAPALDAAQAVQAVAAKGHWDVRKLEYERGQWNIKALDDDGRMGRFRVDGVNGAVIER